MQEIARQFAPHYVPADPPAPVEMIDSWEDLKLLWKDAGIQRAYARRSEFQLDDSAALYVCRVTVRVMVGVGVT